MKIVGFSCPYCDTLNEFETLNNYDSMDELILAKRLLQQILRMTYFNKIISVTWSYNELYVSVVSSGNSFQYEDLGSTSPTIISDKSSWRSGGVVLITLGKQVPSTFARNLDTASNLETTFKGCQFRLNSHQNVDL